MDKISAQIERERVSKTRRILASLIFPILFASLYFFSTPSSASAATLYWYGGTGNWSDYTHHWSNNSGNSPASPASAVPATTDNVIFDINSNATAYTVTIDTDATSADMTWGNPTSGNPVLHIAAGKGIAIYGSAVYASGMTTSADSIASYLEYFATSGTKTITSNSVVMNASLFFYGYGTLRLMDDLIATANLNANGHTTFDANGKTIYLVGTDQSIHDATGSSLAFYNLTRAPATPSKNDSLKLLDNITVAGTFSVSDGATATNRVLIYSYTNGDAKTITAANVSISNADFLDITGAGAASWNMSAAVGGSGNCGNNSMKALGSSAFTPATTQYFYKASGNDNWSTAGNWYLGSGGTGGAGHVPLCQDTARLDANSFGATGMTLTQDVPRLGSVDWTGVTNSPLWDCPVTNTLHVFGNFLLANGIIGGDSMPAQIYFEGRSTYYLKFDAPYSTWPAYYAGNAFGGNQYIDNPGGNLILLDRYLGRTYLHFIRGSFTTNNLDVANTDQFKTDTTNVRSLTLGASTYTLNGPDNIGSPAVWNINPTNLTFDAGSSTIKFTYQDVLPMTFAGAGLTYHNLWFHRYGADDTYAKNGVGDYRITGANTFTGYFKDDNDTASTITFPNTTTTAASWDIQGKPGAIQTLQRTGSSDTFTLAKTGGGIVTADYISVSNSVVTPANTWFAGPHSIDGGNNSGWTFDSTAPITTDSGTDTNWHNTPVTVTLSCVDTSGSGCSHTYYTTDGSDPTTSSSSGTSVVLSTNGTYTIKYFSVDAVGNSEAIKTATNQVKIDVTAPSSISAPTFSTITSSSIVVVKPSSVTEIGSGLYEWQARRNSTTTLGYNAVATTSVTDSSLSENTQYTYDATFKDLATNVGNYGTEASKYTLVDIPTNLTGTVNTTSIILSVDAFPNATSGFSGYYFSNSTNSTNSGWIQTNSWTDSNLNCGNYTYTVKYRNGDGVETGSISTSKATNCVGGGGGGMPVGWSNVPVVPTGGFKVIANYGVSTTTSRNITLNFNAGPDVKKMTISLTGDFRDATQENYSPTKQIDLCSKLGGLIKNPTCPDGQYTVYAKFYTTYGVASNVVSTKVNLSTTPIKNIPTTSAIFTKPLSFGMTSSDVRRLQTLLATKPEIYPKGLITGYFGLLTKKAVQDFQLNYGVVTSKSDSGFGYVGSKTRAKLQEVFGK